MIQFRDQTPAQGEGQKSMASWQKQERGAFLAETVTLEKAIKKEACCFSVFSFSSFLFTFQGNGFTCEIMSGSSHLQNVPYSLNQQVTKFNTQNP